VFSRHRGCDPRTRESTNHGQLPDIWKLADASRAAPQPPDNPGVSTCRFVLQWDDEGNPRDSVMTLFDALGSAEKTLHANPGSHYRVPSFEICR
jgi:hypothetical protein